MTNQLESSLMKGFREQRNNVIDACIEVAMAAAVVPNMVDLQEKEPPIVTATRICNSLARLKAEEPTK